MSAPLRSEGAKSQYMKSLVVSEGKSGKTTFLVSSILGALPGQKQGLVTTPKHLHVLAFDSNAVGGLAEFLTKICGRADEVLDVCVHNMAAAFAKAAESQADWDYGFFNAVCAEISAVKREIAATPGVHAVLASSLTGLSEGLQRGLAGPPSASKKGGGMDMAKWQDLSRQLIEIRNKLQSDHHHIFWEGHVMKTGGADPQDTMGVQGSAGKNWSFNVEQVFRLRRQTDKHPGTVIDKQYLETRPSLDFVSGGRGFTGILADKEYDLVDVAAKLGYRTGGYVAPTAVQQKGDK